MRESSPMPFMTWLTSAPAASQILPIALMKEILAARNAFEAYLITSAEGRSVMIIGRSSGAYSSTSVIATCWVGAPITIRSGRSVSSIAEPSRRNSGFETTSKSMGRGLVAGDDLADELAGTDGHGGLVHDDLVAVHGATDLGRDRLDLREIGLAAVFRWRADGDEDHVRLTDAGGEVRREGEPAIVGVPDHHLLEARLVDGHPAGLERLDLRAVVVHADDVIAQIGEHRTRDQADVSSADDADVHGHTLPYVPG